MNRGELYRVRRPPGDPKPARVVVIVSRQRLIATDHTTLVCAPVHSQRFGLATEVDIGPQEGLLHDSAIRCDGLISVHRGLLTDFIGTLGPGKLRQLAVAIGVALGLDDEGH